MTTKQGAVLIVGGLLTLASFTAIACSDKSRSTRSVPDRTAGVSAIFEKGKAYDVMTQLRNDPVDYDYTITVTEIGPQPWLRVTIKGVEAEEWLNANHIVLVRPAAPWAPSKVPLESQPAAPTINTGDGEIPTFGDISTDGLKYLGTLCHKYMVKRGESWFMCHMENGEQRVCEYRGVGVSLHSNGVPEFGPSMARHGATEAQRLNGVEWNGQCEGRYSVMRTFINGKWDLWADAATGPQLWQTSLSKEKGVWEAKIEGFLPTSEWSIPKDSK